MEKFDKLIKIVLVGDAFSGKTTFTKRICYDEKDINYDSTIGTDIGLMFMNHNDTYYKVQFYDTTGHLKFIQIIRCYYKGCDACILFFDITNKNSFENIKFWLRDIEENIDEKSPLIQNKILIGCKSDIRYTSHNFVTYEEARSLADNFGLKYYEISSLNDDIIELKKIIRNIIDEIDIYKSKYNLKDNNKSKERYRCCNLSNCTIS